ncbi:MAG: hypothetical protein Fur0037_14460 [Planctomycetota bacterium]
MNADMAATTRGGTARKPAADHDSRAARAPGARAKGRNRRGASSSAKKKASSPKKRTPAPKKRARSQTSSIEIDGDVLEFIEAIDRYKKESGRPFPGWSEVLHVLRQLGYRKS